MGKRAPCIVVLLDGFGDSFRVEVVVLVELPLKPLVQGLAATLAPQSECGYYNILNWPSRWWSKACHPEQLQVAKCPLNTRNLKEWTMMAADTPIPVTVLTGYLGAGKTTLLNRILTEQHGKRYAVIINEFGEVGIDNDLVVDADEEVFEMNNGCICCTVRGDLIRIIGGLMKRKDKFDAILVETTGLADPGPVVQTFFVDEEVRAKTRLDAVVTVVDAKNLGQRLADSHEAEEQIAFADVILLNKVDLVSPEEVGQVEKRIRGINPYAKLHKTERSRIAIGEVLGRGAFDLDRILAVEPDFLTDEHAHEHDSAVTSVSVKSEDAVVPERFFSWMQGVIAEKGVDILRMKGILAMADSDQRYVIQGVHMLVEGDHQRPWKAGEPRESRLVFIGRNLDAEALRRGFEACIAS